MIMSAENRQQALEQLVTVMQSEVLARASAAQAEQQATDAETRSLTVKGEGVVDTRLLGKPKGIDGTSDNWRRFRLKQALIESEVLKEPAITNAALPPRDQRVSTQLYYMLVLLLWQRTAHLAQTCEYEPATAGRESALLLEVLAQTFKGNVRGSLDDFEVWVRRYERTCGEVVPHRVRIVVVQKGIEDKNLRRHLRMHATRLASHNLVRHEIRSVVMARDTLSGPAPMGRRCCLQRQGQGQRQGERQEGQWAKASGRRSTRRPL